MTMVTNLATTDSITNEFVAELRDANLQQDPLRFRVNLKRLGSTMAIEVSKSLLFACIGPDAAGHRDRKSTCRATGAGHHPSGGVAHARRVWLTSLTARNKRLCRRAGITPMKRTALSRSELTPSHRLRSTARS